jgi:transcriptional regulator with XRE-family HTH domain
MGETRDRGVLASSDGIQKLKSAQAGRRNTDGRIWTLRDIAIESGIEERTVGRFLRREARVDEKTARSICEVLGVTYEEAIDLQSSEIEEDRTGQISGNPFIYGDPVPPEKFYGRQAARLDVKNRIGAIMPQSINIVGFSGMGKTSLLNYIKARPMEFIANDRKPMIINLDLGNTGRFSSPADVLEGLRRGIMREQNGQEPWSQDENDNSWAVEDGLERLKNRGVLLVVILDEFDMLAPRLDQFQLWGSDWRSKASIQRLFSLVVASKRPISEIYKSLEKDSPFDNMFSLTILSVLERDSWQKLVQEGFIESKVSKSILDLIDDLTGGFPLYVQMIGALLRQEQELKQVEKTFAIQSEQRLWRLWKDLNKQEKIVVQNLDDDIAVINRLKQYGIVRTDGKLFSRVFMELVRGTND